MKIIRIIPAVVALAATALLLTEVSRKTADKKIPAEEEARSEALEALQWISRGRAYPNADIPADAYSRAMAQQHTRFANQQSPASGAWTSIGPNNIGGRTLCLALDPNDTNTVWLGSASGGLWKSTSGGMGPNAWNHVPTGFPVLGVAAIAINPSNASEMYIGTGEGYNQGTNGNGLTDRITRGTYGMGILKSTDGGATWSYSLNWSYQQQRTVWDIVINPLRPQTVFAATSEGIYKSTNAGASWSQVLNVPMCMDIALHESDTTVLLTGAGNINSVNKGLFRSADGGLSWSQAGNGFPNTAHTGRIMVEMYPGNNDIVMAQLCDMYNTIGFFRSTDKGLNWTAVSNYDVVGYQGWYCAGMAFKPGDSNSLLAGGVDMHLTTDGGNSFSQVSNNSWTLDYVHSDIHAITVNPQNPNSVYIATDGGLFRTWDFGVSYTECTDGYVTSQCYIGSLSQTDPNYALTGLQDNNTIMYNGSPYWTPVLGGDGCYNLIDPSDDNINFAAYQYLNVYQTTDKWQSSFFQVISTPASAFGGNPSAFLSPYLYAPSNTAVMYAGENDLLKSTDGGFSWSVVSPSPIDSGNVILTIGVSHTNEDSLYIATAPDFAHAKFMISADGGQSFTDRSAGLPDRFPRRIAVDPRDSRIVYIVYSGFGTGHIFKSTNAGQSWTDISTALPDVPFHCVFLDPQHPDIVYAGSDIGLYVSTDAGATWMTHNTGLPDWTMVFDLAATASDRSLLCFTHGHGVWKRSLDDILGTAETNASAVSFSVFPNPAVQTASLSFGELYGPAQISIYDLNGKRMYSETKTIDSSRPLITVNVAEWESGVYLVNVISEGKSATRKLIVQH